MHSLTDIQDLFQRHLLEGDNTISDYIVQDQKITIQQRLATYRNAYHARLIEALSTDFPSVRDAVGAETFNAICLTYIQHHPSSYASLRWFGSQFPDFIKQQALLQSLPYIHELSIMEWCFADAFDAVDRMPLTITAMASIPATLWPEIQLTFHPSVCHFKMHWNTVDIWNAIKNGTTLPAANLNEIPATCLIWRQGLSTQFRVLETDESVLMLDALRGANFGQLCEKLSTLPEYAISEDSAIALRSAALLKNWLQDGLITAINH